MSSRQEEDAYSPRFSYKCLIKPPKVSRMTLILGLEDGGKMAFNMKTMVTGASLTQCAQ